MLNNTLLRQIDYDQGAAGGRVNIMLECKYVFPGVQCFFWAQHPLPPILLQPTTVTTWPSFITGITADLPAGYKSVFFYGLFVPETSSGLPGLPEFELEFLMPGDEVLHHTNHVPA